MRFLINTQLPAKLAELLSVAGHDVVHTAQLLDGNRTTDAALAALADEQDRVFSSNLETIIAALSEATFVELGSAGLVIHDDKSAR